MTQGGSGPSSSGLPAGTFGRRPGAMEAVAFALHVPAALASLVVMFWVAGLGSYLSSRGDPMTVGLIAIGLYALGAVALATPLGDWLVMRSFKQRPANDYEAPRLDPVWARLCTRVGVPAATFTLRVEDSDEINAFAAGSRSVTITRDAVKLPPDELEAILAHELGHHARWHGLIGLYGWYFTGPTRLLASISMWAIQFVWRVLVGAMGGAASVGSIWGVLIAFGILLILGYVLLPYLILPLGFVVVVDSLSALAARRLELRADRRAADWGYGAGLVKGLITLTWSGVPHADHQWFERASSTHPAPRARISKLMQILTDRDEVTDDLTALVARTDPAHWGTGSTQRLPAAARHGEPWGLARLTPELRHWVHAMAPTWDDLVRRLGTQITVMHHTPDGHSQGGWIVMAGTDPWEPVPFDPPHGMGGQGPRSAQLRQTVMQAYLEERQWGGTIHMRSKEHGDIYRTITL